MPSDASVSDEGRDALDPFAAFGQFLILPRVGVHLLTQVFGLHQQVLIDLLLRRIGDFVRFLVNPRCLLFCTYARRLCSP